jgi:hypothetical protein
VVGLVLKAPKIAIRFALAKQGARSARLSSFPGDDGIDPIAESAMPGTAGDVLVEPPHLETEAAFDPVSWEYKPWFAWFPVIPEDERGVFWLENVWVRYNRVVRRWSYRSFRTKEQRQAQIDREYPYGL